MNSGARKKSIWCSFVVVHVGSLREKMASRPPPKVIEFVEPGKQRRERKAVWPLVRTDFML